MSRELLILKKLASKLAPTEVISLARPHKILHRTVLKQVCIKLQKCLLRTPTCRSELVSRAFDLEKAREQARSYRGNQPGEAAQNPAPHGPETGLHQITEMLPANRNL
ncbi:hypothetical protein GV729_21870 [Pseudomonas sp. Fl4BN2]|nr:hypothetical protein [Pseudomonas sp. Fl4BN2]